MNIFSYWSVSSCRIRWVTWWRPWFIIKGLFSHDLIQTTSADSEVCSLWANDHTHSPNDEFFKSNWSNKSWCSCSLFLQLTLVSMSLKAERITDVFVHLRIQDMANIDRHTQKRSRLNQLLCVETVQYAVSLKMGTSWLTCVLAYRSPHILMLKSNAAGSSGDEKKRDGFKLCQLFQFVTRSVNFRRQNPKIRNSNIWIWYVTLTWAVLCLV